MTSRFIYKGTMMAIAIMLSCFSPLIYAQTTQQESVTITANKKSLENILEKLSKQYNYQFFYNSSLLKRDQRIRFFAEYGYTRSNESTFIRYRTAISD